MYVRCVMECGVRRPSSLSLGNLPIHFTVDVAEHFNFHDLPLKTNEWGTN